MIRNEVANTTYNGYKEFYHTKKQKKCVVGRGTLETATRYNSEVTFAGIRESIHGDLN
jgi:hypothetical protein